MCFSQNTNIRAVKWHKQTEDKEQEKNPTQQSRVLVKHLLQHDSAYIGLLNVYLQVLTVQQTNQKVPITSAQFCTQQ